jgi:hypothetical protein
MPDPPAGDSKKGGLLGQILAAVVIALIAGGTSPWWFNVLFPKENSNPSERVSVPGYRFLSRDFMVGRWQTSASSGYEAIIDLSASGRVEGTFHENESSYQTSGTWDFQKLSEQRFILKLAYSSITDSQNSLDTSKDPPLLMKLEVRDQNHIHTIDEHENLVFERLR